MKAATLILFLISEFALACPQLGGKYVCLIDGAVQDLLIIEQTVRDGKTIYIKGPQEMIADNAVYPLPDQEYVRNRATQAWCDGDTLTSKEVGKVFEGEKLLLAYENKDFFRTLGAGKFEMTLSNSFYYPDGNVVEYKGHAACELEPE